MYRKSQNSPNDLNSNYYLLERKRAIFYVLILLGIYWITSLYQAVISSLVLGILLAYLLHPIVSFLTNKVQINSRFSAFFVFVLFISIIIVGARLATPILFNQINILTNDFQEISDEIIKFQPVLDDLVNINIPLTDIIPELENEINQLLVPARMFRMLRSATDNFVWIMVTFMTCFYLLLDHQKLVKWIYNIAPHSLRDTLVQILEEINLVWKTYLRGQFSMMLLIGLLSGIGGVAVGLKNALIIGVIAGILELIPSLGPTVSTFIAGMSAWTQGSITLNISNFWFAIIVCSIFIIIQVLENTVLIPKVMSRRMKIHPALVFIAIVSTLSLYGILAGLIVVPVIGSLVVIINFSAEYLDRDARKPTSNKSQAELFS